MATEVFLYLTTRGRSSGLPRRIEIWFVAVDHKHFMIAELGERAGWVMNARAHPEVMFSVGTREDPEAVLGTAPALARPLDDVADAAETARVRAAMQSKYGWSDGLIVELTPIARG